MIRLSVSMVIVPLGAVAEVTTKVSPSMSLSLASTLMVTGLSSSMVALSGCTSGASLTGFMVMATVALSLALLGSVMV